MKTITSLTREAQKWLCVPAALCMLPAARCMLPAAQLIAAPAEGLGLKTAA